jgi:hypothetical protein
VRSSDALALSTQVIVALPAATKTKLDEFDVSQSVTKLLGALTHSVAHSLSHSAHLASSLCLQVCLLRLRQNKVSMELKEDLLRLPLFEDRLFPASLRFLLERERQRETMGQVLQNLLKQTLVVSKKAPAPAPLRPQPEPQFLRGSSAKARGGKRRSGPPSAYTGGSPKKPPPFRRGKSS